MLQGVSVLHISLLDMDGHAHLNRFCISPCFKGYFQSDLQLVVSSVWRPPNFYTYFILVQITYFLALLGYKLHFELSLIYKVLLRLVL